MKARSEDTLRASIIDRLFPPEDYTFPLTMRSLRTPFLDEWETRPDLHESDLDNLRDQMTKAIESGRMHEYAAGAGESVGMIRDIIPAAKIVQRLVAEAEATLMNAAESVVATRPAD